MMKYIGLKDRFGMERKVSMLLPRCQLFLFVLVLVLPMLTTMNNHVSHKARKASGCYMGKYIGWKDNFRMERRFSSVIWAVWKFFYVCVNRRLD